MFEHLARQPEDKVMALMTLFRQDQRTNKIDLGVGVYRNADGVTPIMSAVKRAEQMLWQQETTKGYTRLTGEPAFLQAMQEMLLKDACAGGDCVASATTGGTGAIRLGLELIKLANPKARVWLSSPTWSNHAAILDYLHMPWLYYRYFDATARAVDFDGMMDDLLTAESGDVVLLHGCCHNPTGANLSQQQWMQLAGILQAKALIPFVDIAYQGFGDGLEEDAFGVRYLAATLPETLIAASCSKNFGLYRERTGLLLATARDSGRLAAMQSSFAMLNRLAYSFPPDHGARLVTMILNDSGLRAEWEAELAAIRDSMLTIREQLAAALRQRAGSDRFGFLAQHRGMFSILGATAAQVDAMRENDGVYLVADSRMNIAGLNAATVPILADAVIRAGV